MDDYDVNIVTQSKNEWSWKIVTLLTPFMIEGVTAIFNDAYELCEENGEEDKYLMTFQTLLKRVPKWNDSIVSDETKRIMESGGECKHLETMVSAVHINHLKILSSMRVSQKQKAVEIPFPKANVFIHKCYINFARKIFNNAYLFQYAHNPNLDPMQYQKDMRQCELICHESIIKTIHEGIPVEQILKAYMDETEVEEIIEEVVEKIDDTPVEKEETSATNNNDSTRNGVDSLVPGGDIIKVEKPTLNHENMQNIHDSDNNSIVSGLKSFLGNNANHENNVNDKNKDVNVTINVKTEKNDTQTTKISTPKQGSSQEMDDFLTNLNNNTKKVDKEESNKPRLSFNNNDSILDMGTNKESIVSAPKTIKRLEDISQQRNEQRKAEEEEDDEDEDEDDNDGKLVISDIPVELKVTTLGGIDEIELLE